MRDELSHRYLLLLDNSGSMFGEKIAALNMAVSGFIAELGVAAANRKGPLMAIITFGGRAAVHSPFGPVGDIVFDGLTPRGKSKLSEALLLAKTIVNENTDIILFSDGRPDDGGFVRAVADMATSGLYAVGIGYDADFDMLGRFVKHKKHIIAAYDMEQFARYLELGALEAGFNTKELSI